MKRMSFPRVNKRAGVKRESGNIPDELDLSLLNAKINKFCKTLQEDGMPKKLLDVNALKQLVRIAVRKKWMFSNTKLAFLNMRKVPDLDPTSRTRFRLQCNICKCMFKETDVEVDHIEGEKEFTDLSKMMEWAKSILDVSFDDLQILCKPCHKIKSHMDASGLSFEEAAIEKQAIAIINESKGNDKVWLTSKGITPASNAKLRREQIVNKLKEDK
jgi:hypothetical protein